MPSKTEEYFINGLIDSEKDAISEYNTAISLLRNQSEETLAVLKHIRDEEIEHLEELKKLLGEN